MNFSEIEDIKNLIPCIIVDNYYNILALNTTAQNMLGDVRGEKCYKIIYGFDSPCYQKNIKCPVYHKQTNIDTITLDFEVYLRSYGNIPLGGLFYESIINITKLEFVRTAILDSLTKLYNKKFMENFLDKTFTLWRRYKQIFSVIYVDIDHLKEINDNFGHLSGDEAIIKISNCLKANIRASDVTGRLSGDEFLIVLTNTSIKDAEIVALRILRCINEIRFIKKLSVSIGLTEVFETDEGYHSLLERADKALYAVKRSQKGKIGIIKSGNEVYFLELNRIENQI
ncbi:MAG: GGDEF domain-containing protein [Thermodesulfovibrio sp.]|uniref:GGDEF domain-containing protein n=1 Tax=Thermodesulfovibrio sp. 1176 TaxID=3043424 RepID=UPI002483205B|nr:GGDEF domain-containing protein [Thermodesulfovibrio sp. 1176]MDI1471522.1 GGDEF domain-containing protein [Thermodesulfovibrio sp. 1176]MDI6715094.1 GGDEF domain-containing protein [Thermodesulfovibrio sp.]